MKSPADPLDDPARRRRETYRHWISEQVRWSDTDMAGHANNLAFAAFCEVGRAQLLRPFIESNSAHKALMPLVDFRIRFLGELQWAANVDIGTGITTIANSSFVMVHALFDGDRCVAVSDSRLVLIDELARRSRPLTAEIRACLEHWSLKPAINAQEAQS